MEAECYEELMSLWPCTLAAPAAILMGLEVLSPLFSRLPYFSDLLCPL
jgi:hypothetical protein